MANGWPILLTSLFKTSQNLFLLHWQKGLIALVASHLFQPFQTCLKKLTNQKQRFSPKIPRQKKKKQNEQTKRQNKMYLQGKKTNDMQPLLTKERNSSFKTCFSLFCYFIEENLHIEFLSED